MTPRFQLALMLAWVVGCADDPNSPAVDDVLWGDEPLDTAADADGPLTIAEGGACPGFDWVGLWPGESVALRFTPPAWPWALQAISVLQGPSESGGMEAALFPELVLSAPGEELDADPVFLDAESTWYPANWSRYASIRLFDAPVVLEQGQAPFVVLRHPGNTQEWAMVQTCTESEEPATEQLYAPQVEAPYDWSSLADVGVPHPLRVAFTAGSEEAP